MGGHSELALMECSEGDELGVPTGAESEALDSKSRVNFRVGDLAEALMDHPGSPSSVAKLLVSRWVAFVDDELRKIRDVAPFTEAEAMVLTESLRGIPLEPVTVPLITEAIRQAAVIRRAGRDRGVDGEQLVAKVAGFNTSGGIAMLDAVERFWALEDRIQDPRDRLVRVGLLEAP